MPSEKPAFKPTRDETATNLLRLGHLLHQFSHPKGPFGFSRPLKPSEEERLRTEITALEKRIEEAVCDSRQWLLRSVLGVRKNEVVDNLTIRIVASVCWWALATERPDSSVAVVANEVSLGDWSLHLEGRRAIRLMVERQLAIQIRDSEYHGQVLSPNSRLIGLLSGHGNLPIVFSAKSIEEEREDRERKQGPQLLKRVSPPPGRAEPPPAPPATLSDGLMTAKTIYGVLKDHVIALDGPLRRFSAQMSLHMRRLEQIRKGVRPSVGPIVTLLIGSSSSGKTWMAECFARASGLPYAVADMSSVSQSSFVGLSLDECFYPLLSNKTRPSEAQKGVLVLDEIDKVCAKGDGGHLSVDPQGRGIQAELLKPLEGCKLPLGSRRSNAPLMGVLDTYETCFVLAGAFDGLREQITDGKRHSTGLGFVSVERKVGRNDIREALVKYGFLEQIISRVGSVIILPDPKPENIVSITTHPGTGLLARTNSFLGSFGMRLLPTEDALRHLAGWACETRGFSRAVKNILGTLVEAHLIEDRRGDIEVTVADVRRAIGDAEGTECL